MNIENSFDVFFKYTRLYKMIFNQQTSHVESIAKLNLK
jgi:hypothetical protein